MITVESLTKTYADAEAVSALSFSVEKGEILGLLGPNGAGKTTTMRMLTCFLPPTSGTATLAGYDIYEQSLEVRKKVGYLPENVPLYGEMRVDEYLLFRARLKGVPRSATSPRLDYVVDRCGLRDVRHKVIDHLSKGYRQRVGLADALVHNPPILILDEPTVGLDPNQIRQVREMIRDLGAEHTIILSSHILPEVEQVCGRVLIINKGRIVAQDTTEALRQELGGTSRLEIEIGGAPGAILEALRALPGVLAVHENPRTPPAGSAAGAREASSDHAGSVGTAAREEPGPGAPLARSSAGDWQEWPKDAPVVQATLECAPGSDPREAVFRLAVARGWVLLGLTRRQRSLEDIFINLTTREPDMSAVSASEPGAGPEVEPPVVPGGGA